MVTGNGFSQVELGSSHPQCPGNGQKVARAVYFSPDHRSPEPASILATTGTHSWRKQKTCQCQLRRGDQPSLDSCHKGKKAPQQPSQVHPGHQTSNKYDEDQRRAQVNYLLFTEDYKHLHSGKILIYSFKMMPPNLELSQQIITLWDTTHHMLFT